MNNLYEMSATVHIAKLVISSNMNNRVLCRCCLTNIGKQRNPSQPCFHNGLTLYLPQPHQGLLAMPLTHINIYTHLHTPNQISVNKAGPCGHDNVVCKLHTSRCVCVVRCY